MATSPHWVSFVQSMMAGLDQVAHDTCSREWYHNCNTGNVTADGKYLEEVETFDTDGIQGRHIPDYFEQRRTNVEMMPNCLLWGGV